MNWPENTIYYEERKELVRAGDHGIWTKIFEEYSAPVSSFLLRRLDSSNMAEELCQEVFLSAFVRRESWGNHGRFHMGGWLRSIAFSRSIDFYRKNSRTTIYLDPNYDIPSDVNIEDIVERRFEIEALSDAIQKLLESQKQTIILDYFADLDNDTIAQLANTTTSAVKTRKYRAINSLRRSLEKTFD